MSQAATADVPEVFHGIARPPIEQYERLARASTPNSWIFKGVIWEHGHPPEFDVVVDPVHCGEHERDFDDGNVISWTMGITKIVEERRTSDAEGGVVIPGNDIAWVEQVPGLSTVMRDVTGEQVTVPTFALRFKRPEDAEFIRRARESTNRLCGYVRALETYASAKTNEWKWAHDRVVELEKENAQLRALLNGDDD